MRHIVGMGNNEFQKRLRDVRVRATDDEHESWIAQARRLGLTLSAYIRLKLSGEAVH